MLFSGDAVVAIARFTADRILRFPTSWESAVFFFLEQCKAEARREGYQTITADNVVRIARQHHSVDLTHTS